MGVQRRLYSAWFLLYQFTADSVVIKDITTITTPHSCSLWCYGHHTTMLCALPSQECSDIRIKAFDLRGETPHTDSVSSL